ncbi:MAG: P-loop NTPase family protein, partial [Rhodospirillaceae bacterium]
MTNSTSPMDLVARLAERIDLNADTHPFHAPQPAFPHHPADGKADPERFPAWPGVPPIADDADDSGPQIDLDLEMLAKRGYLASGNPHSLLAEEYRIIKRPMLRTAFTSRRDHGERDHMILVTSARPNEGKTFTSINLGMSIASEHDVQILLIDGDVRRKGLSLALGVDDRKGLMNILCDPGVSLADTILRTNIPHFSILPAGHFAGAPTEILASQKMKQLADDLGRRYADRIVIFDS